MKPSEFDSGTALGNGLYGWWKNLDDNRADRAELRRCQTLDEVALTGAYQRFYRYLDACHSLEGAKRWQLDRLAAIAGLLAHVKTHTSERLPIAMSAKNGDKNTVSELRFRGLLKITDTEGLFGALRRLLPLIDHSTDIHQLAKDVYGWSSTSGRVPREWAYAYDWPKKPSN